LEFLRTTAPKSPPPAGSFRSPPPPNRQALIRQGQRLEYFTVAYNSAEGLVSIIAGLIAGSVSLIGFGLDSVIEVASGAALLWRLHHDLDHSRREQVERITLRTVGGCFIALALYILYESGSTLIGHKYASLLPTVALGFAARIGNGALWTFMIFPRVNLGEYFKYFLENVLNVRYLARPAAFFTSGHLC
jgi:divalent metal cation (Fe/Co/Zn/Cd) transporter